MNKFPGRGAIMRADSLVNLAMAAAGAILITPDGVAGPAPQPGMTWESIRSLADFGGSWSMKLQPVPRPVLRPALAALFSAWERKTSNGEDPSDVDGIKRSYCGPARFWPLRDGRKGGHLAKATLASGRRGWPVR